MNIATRADRLQPLPAPAPRTSPRRWSLGLLFAVLTLVGSALPASADPAGTAYLVQTNYLSARPITGMQPIRISRTIYLGTSYYRLRATFRPTWSRDPYESVSPELPLPSGTYQLDAAISPQNGYYVVYASIGRPGATQYLAQTAVRFYTNATAAWNAVWGLKIYPTRSYCASCTYPS